MATKAELRDRAANDLGLLPVGQTLGAADTTRIETAYAEVYAQLKTDGLDVWASDGSCPAEITPYVAALMADNCLGTYSTSAERYQRIKLEAGMAMTMIRQYVQPNFASAEDGTDY